MFRFIAAALIGFFLSFGYSSFVYYQLAGGTFGLGTVIITLLMTALFTSGNYFLTFWHFAGIPRKPQLWKYYEEKGIEYTYKRDNLNLLLMFMLSLGIFTALSFAFDASREAQLGTTMLGIFRAKKEAYLGVQNSFFWAQDYWYLFLPVYLFSALGTGVVFWQAFLRRDMTEVPEQDGPASLTD